MIIIKIEQPQQKFFPSFFSQFLWSLKEKERGESVQNWPNIKFLKYQFKKMIKKVSHYGHFYFGGEKLKTKIYGK